MLLHRTLLPLLLALCALPCPADDALTCVDVDASAVFAPAAERVYARVEAFYAANGIAVSLRTLPSYAVRTRHASLVLVMDEANFCELAEPKGREYAVTLPAKRLTYMMDTNAAYFGRALSTNELELAWSAVLAHEVGHLLGLMHVPDEGGVRNLMAADNPPLSVAVLTDQQRTELAHAVAAANHSP